MYFPIFLEAIDYSFHGMRTSVVLYLYCTNIVYFDGVVFPRILRLQIICRFLSCTQVALIPVHHVNHWFLVRFSLSKRLSSYMIPSRMMSMMIVFIHSCKLIVSLLESI